MEIGTPMFGKRDENGVAVLVSRLSSSSTEMTAAKTTEEGGRIWGNPLISLPTELTKALSSVLSVGWCADFCEHWARKRSRHLIGISLLDLLHTWLRDDQECREW